MVKKRSRSLASRKRAKDMSAAMEDHVFTHEMKRAEPPKASWETALPRKLRTIMQWQQVERGEKPKPRQREDLPRPAKQPNAASQGEQRGRGGDSWAVPVSAPPSKRKGGERTEAQRKQEHVQLKQQQQQLPPPPLPTAISAKEGKRKQPAEKVRFGETNDRPPELMLIGQLAKKIRREKEGP
uniref:Uncharacterized protein n=1 Tax=Calcidiscus leptoporus TaxID=127549 RepID=A0A7S0JKY1_9EUKA|mmetsp:Transcript_9783/g.22608  ORF Transcript_9783/g.22608 Transcript_9783/m.22608 type:complete len:183 (+) Transcript_9783:115-663(+)